MFATTLEKLRWEFLRRNPEYIRDYENREAVADECGNEWLEKIQHRWGINKFADPKVDDPGGLCFAPPAIIELYSKSELQMIGFIDKSEHTSEPIQAGISPHLEKLQELTAGPIEDEKRFLSITLDVKMFSNHTEIMDFLAPSIEKFARPLTAHNKNLPKKILHLEKHIQAFDDFIKLFRKEYDEEIESVEDEYLEKILSKKMKSGKMFKSALPKNAEGTLATAFALIRRAPFISRGE